MDKELNNQFGQSNNHPNSSETTGGDEFGQSTKQLTNSSETPVEDEFARPPPISPMRGDGGMEQKRGVSIGDIV